MLRQAFGVRQGRTLQRVTRFTQNVSPFCMSKTRTFQTTTCLLHDGGNDTGSVPQSTTSLDDKLDYFNKELTAMKSEMKRFAESLDTKESISNLKLARLESEMMHLNKNLTTQMTSFCEKISAKISVLDANMESRLDKFESRFLFRIVFVAVSVAVAVGGTVAATLLRSLNSTTQTPTTQAPQDKHV
ncbi:uncharacterized protein PV06_04991 [Exophiala oligosperma]|uniref:Uncharacterized protein n=1 Tax=Exophiala oligosperma TaxID=215243 RepID=A0A0D2DNB7_9EURO|nr:uncharacterized protein PV06_04991 [Exophiala oligosperma]KIW43945.1 hypothetical protein PV06_04991 [Exophiala oligosperma]